MKVNREDLTIGTRIAFRKMGHNSAIYGVVKNNGHIILPSLDFIRVEVDNSKYTHSGYVNGEPLEVYINDILFITQ